MFEEGNGQEIKRPYTPEDIAGFDYRRDLGLPGEFPYTRGVYPSMYRGRLWTMRQFSGFGTPEETNRRYHYLLSEGNAGLSVAFDMPSLMGYDSDHPRAKGEVGRCGVAVDTLEDMEAIFRAIPLDKVTTSMTINGPAIVLLAMYVAVADRRGIPRKKLGGTIQNDILKEYIAQKEWICPPLPSLKLINDTIRFCVEETPRFHPISVSGYHIREAGATAIQELAFTLYDGLTYVQSAMDYGLQVDEFAPSLSFFFNAHNDFFEEIAKFRAARRLWAREMERRFRPRNPASLALRFHAQTAGSTLTAQQPYNNVVRVALQALAAVLGGTQSLHTNSLDESLALPTEEAVRLALRTQQIIAFESGVTRAVDPLGGSYYVESLTNRMEEEARRYFKRLDDLGGMVAAIERGFPQHEIHEAALAYQRSLEKRERTVVGVNALLQEEERPLPILRIGAEVEKLKIKRLRLVKTRRKEGQVREALNRLAEAARSGGYLVPFVIEAVKSQATLGEICALFRSVYGEYREGAVF
jgi:methylmalonyl-CoA mutase N-terminal domain/subunit